MLRKDRFKSIIGSLRLRDTAVPLLIGTAMFFRQDRKNVTLTSVTDLATSTIHIYMQFKGQLFDRHCFISSALLYAVAPLWFIQTTATSRDCTLRCVAPPRRLNEDIPAAHFGLIVTGNGLQLFPDGRHDPHQTRGWPSTRLTAVEEGTFLMHGQGNHRPLHGGEQCDGWRGLHHK